MTMKAVQLLLVEDNPGDVEITRVALREGKIATDLHVALDGQQAVDFMRRTNGFEDAPRPDLVLLDLNLPRLSGRDVLATIKEDDELKPIPVVIMSSSNSERDVEDTYRMHANCYVQKPFDLDHFTQVVGALKGFWFSMATLPSSRTRGIHAG